MWKSQDVICFLTFFDIPQVTTLKKVVFALHVHWLLLDLWVWRSTKYIREGFWIQRISIFDQGFWMLSRNIWLFDLGNIHTQSIFCNVFVQNTLKINCIGSRGYGRRWFFKRLNNVLEDHDHVVLYSTWVQIVCLWPIGDLMVSLHIKSPLVLFVFDVWTIISCCHVKIRVKKWNIDWVMMCLYSFQTKHNTYQNCRRTFDDDDDILFWKW